MNVRVVAGLLALIAVGQPSSARADTPLGPPPAYFETCTLERQCPGGVECVEGDFHTPPANACKPAELARGGFAQRCLSAFRRDEHGEWIRPIAIYCTQDAAPPSYDDCSVERQCPNAGVECHGHIHTGVGAIGDGDGTPCDYENRFTTRCWKWNPSRTVLCDREHPRGGPSRMPWLVPAGAVAVGVLLLALWRRRARS